MRYNLEEVKRQKNQNVTSHLLQRKRKQQERLDAKEKFNNNVVKEDNKEKEKKEIGI